MANDIRTETLPTFNEEEQALLLADLLALKKAQIGEFLAGVGLARSGTKQAQRERIEQAIEQGTLSLTQIVRFLDDVVPWGKQHVYLYKGPQSSIADWRDETWVKNMLGEHRLVKYLNASTPLVLPDKMKVSSILHNSKRLRITAVKRRDWFERSSEYDEVKTTAAGEDVELRAYVHRVTRSLVAFEWNLIANNAFLQMIASEYDLTLADVHAALAYYFDHRPEIDRSIEAGQAFAEALRKHTPSKVQQRDNPGLDADIPSP